MQNQDPVKFLMMVLLGRDIMFSRGNSLMNYVSYIRSVFMKRAVDGINHFCFSVYGFQEKCFTLKICLNNSYEIMIFDVKINILKEHILPEFLIIFTRSSYVNSQKENK